MLDNVTQSFGEATELAEVLMRTNDLDYRLTHQIVGAIATMLVDDEITKKDINPETIRQVSQRVIDREIVIDEQSLSDSLCPKTIVESRIGTGGASPNEVQRMIDEAKLSLGKIGTWITDQQNRISLSQNEFDDACKKIIIQE